MLVKLRRNVKKVQKMRVGSVVDASDSSANHQSLMPDMRLIGFTIAFAADFMVSRHRRLRSSRG
jgi:hypothetical protein